MRADAPIKIDRSPAQWREHLRAVIPSNVLLINMNYGIEQNFDIAHVTAYVDLSHHHVLPADPEKPINQSKAQRDAAEPNILHRGDYQLKSGSGQRAASRHGR